MRHLKKYNENMSDEDAKSLLDLLKSLDSSLSKMKSYAQFQNRMDTLARDEKGNIPGSLTYKVKDEYEEYFQTMIDEGWKYFRQGNVQFYGEIVLKKSIYKSKAESELVNITNDMMEIKSRFEAKGFQCHFLIFFNEKAQQILNTKTHKADIYQFNGIGDGDSEYCQAKINFVYI